MSIHKEDKPQIKSKHTPNPSQEGTAVRIKITSLIYVKCQFIIFYLNAIKTSILKFQTTKKLTSKKQILSKETQNSPLERGGDVSFSKVNNFLKNH